MRVVVRGRDLPGRVCGAYRNVHVALQVRADPEHPVPGDAAHPEWSTEVTVVPSPSGVDFRGPAVHGRRGERFLYLTWGEVDGGRFAMFRRAKLMLADLGERALGARSATVTVSLTDARGMPRCARVGAPDAEWSITE